jgi:sugar transferase (PEP-CTERM/EpsH1 system associated)
VTRNQPPLVVHIIYALTTGGLENGLVNIINRTPSDRYRHAIVCITVADEFTQRITAQGVRVFELNKRPGHDFGFYLRLWRLLRELNPDIIHSRNLAALEAQLAGLGCSGAKRVHGEHGREVNDLDGKNWKYLGFRKFMRLFIDRYIAVSRDLETWLSEVVHVRPEKLRQIYNGVDHDLFSPGTVTPLALSGAHWSVPDDILVIGTVGRLSPVKDQQLLLQAVADMKTTSPDLFRRIRMVIVGDGPLRESLNTRVNELGINESTWFTGDRDDVWTLLAAMDVFVLPSLAEGISNTVLEAMASGLPVIATSVGGNLELVSDGFNGRLIPVGDSASLGAALKAMLENKQERQQQGVNARQWVCERFDWNRTVDAYLGVYDELILSEVSQPRPEPNTENAG